MEKLYRSNGNSLCLYGTHLPSSLTLLFFLLFTFTGYSQIKNGYAKVTGTTTVSGKTQLTIANANTTGHGWVNGEEVIVIQMQDNVISGTGNTNGFGLLSGISSVGLFELANITNSTATTISLDKLLTQPFHFGSNSSVQVVTFTQLSANFTTTANITALPWSGSLGRGGVVAISIPGTFTMKHSVTADGMGFAGGAASNNSSTPTCSSTGNYTSNSTNYGAKGEGAYLVNTVTDPTFVRGRARIVSGGGGGNSGGSGGGGGSNYSAGGDGSSYWTCGTNGGGLGGVTLNPVNYALGNRVIMGGGGGGGQGNGNQSAGGAGGGIVLIRAGAITTSCSGSVQISANGASANNANGDGTGGGGAAGTVLLQISNYSVPSACKLNVQANGGDGGDNTSIDLYGTGGGGGQGAVLVNGNYTMTNVLESVVPGVGGKITNWLSTRGGATGDGSLSGIIGGIGTVLPVHLTYFTADNKNGKAILTWNSTDENKVIYTIERSTDGIDFTAIGRVTGTGQSSYTYTDPNPINGRVYYRLVLSGDSNAQTTYSSVVSVTENNASQVAAAYPNPAHDYFYIRITGDNTNKPYKVAVTDLAGQVVYTTAGIPANNIMKVTPGKVLKPGLYMFKVTGDGFEQSGKLMIQ